MTDGYRTGGFDSGEGGMEETARGLAESHLETPWPLRGEGRAVGLRLRGRATS